jgi:IS1 family transposase
MNHLSNIDRCRVLACLVEGNSIRATVRITGIAKRTVSRLVVELGEACERFADRTMRGLECQSLQCDEIWAFCGAKEKNATPEQKEKGWGDAWTWVAIDPTTKLIPQWFVGDRSAATAYKFMLRLSRRLLNRIQLTTDGHKSYLVAVKAAFPDGIDYAQLVKLYDSPVSGRQPLLWAHGRNASLAVRSPNLFRPATPSETISRSECNPADSPACGNCRTLSAFWRSRNSRLLRELFSLTNDPVRVRVGVTFAALLLSRPATKGTVRPGRPGLSV